MIRRLKLLFCAVLGTLAMSCSDWLKVSSEDRIMENDLFRTPHGFMTSLNGIYIDLLNTSLYGKTLTWGMPDILAQYYTCREKDHVYSSLATFDNVSKNSAVSGTWSRSHTLLNNVNTLLEHCESDRSVLDDTYYHIIKGEALALRALLNFELFRIFGPNYNGDKDSECLPYALTSETKINPLLPAKEIVRLIMEDLKNAEELLAGYDPVIEEGVVWADEPDGGVNDMRYRSMRLNYYAVQALIARVALYCGDKEMAWEYADKMIRGIHEEHKWFPFVTQEEVAATEKEDRIFQNEILFGLYNLKRKENVYAVGFGPNLKQGSVLRIDKDIMNEMYEGDENDFRLAYWFSDMVDPDNNSYTHMIKYMDVDDLDTKTEISKGYTYILPVLRVSEVYLIAAECCPDPKVGRDYLNAVRSARNVKNVADEVDLMTVIEQEFRREFLGEGQLFWLYKRKGKAEIISGEAQGKVVSMEERFYLFDLPQSERDYREENGIGN